MLTYERMEIIEEKLINIILVIMFALIGATVPTSLGVGLTADAGWITRDACGETFLIAWFTLASLLIIGFIIYEQRTQR